MKAHDPTLEQKNQKLHGEVTELESQQQATAVQLFENETSQIFSGENMEEMNCYMLPTAPPAEQPAVGKIDMNNWHSPLVLMQLYTILTEGEGLGL